MMKKTKKVNRDEYDIRTLSYYQMQGGVYNDLITYLTQLRSKPEHRGMPSPASLLNEACYHRDVLAGMEEKEAEQYRKGIKSPLVLDLLDRLIEGKKQELAALSLQAIIDYILAHKQYQFVNQIINMLKDMVGRTCTDEEYRQILAAEQKVMDDSRMEVHNHNDIRNSNVFTGLVDHPTYQGGRGNE